MDANSKRWLAVRNLRVSLAGSLGWLATAALLCPRGTDAAETEWRFDGTVASVSSPLSQSIPIGAPVRGVFVLDRAPAYVQTGTPCTDGSATRVFYSIRESSFFVTGASGTGITSSPSGADCAPSGLCDVTETILDALTPPACQAQMLEIDFDASSADVSGLGDVQLTLGLQPSLLPPGFYTSIPDAPWAAAPGGLFGSISSTAGNIQLDVTSLSRAQVCGDINLDLLVDGTDVALLRNELANPSAPFPSGGAARCSVVGTATDCDVVDVAVLRRALAGGLPPGVQEVCAAMNGG